MVTGMFQSIRQVCAKQLYYATAATGAPDPKTQQLPLLGEPNNKYGLLGRQKHNALPNWARRPNTNDKICIAHEYKKNQ